MKPVCARCGHTSDWHRLDDALDLDPTDPATPFRCLGLLLNGCAYACPDFVAEEEL